MSAAAALILFFALGALPPLTAEQQAQVATASDFSPAWDEGALYPLLQNALQWPGHDEAGALIPDYDAMLADPARYRGQLCLVEGQLGGPVEVVPYRLSRAGPWDDKLQRWGILVRADPDLVVVVYLVDGPPLAQTPRPGVRVRLLGRFYKVWRQPDQNHQPTDYLVFIGKTTAAAAPAQRYARYRTTPMQWNLRWVLLLLVVGVAAIYLLRRMTRLSMQPRPLPGQLRRRQERAHAGQDAGAQERADLPRDPAAALDQLARREQPSTDFPPAAPQEPTDGVR